MELIKLSAKPESCEKLLREDAEAVFTRKKLMEKQERLEKANIKLMRFASTDVGSHTVFDVEGDDDDDL